ncbi:Paf1 complex component [Haematococcus lacustris]
MAAIPPLERLLIPVLDTEEVVSVDLHNLPSEADELLEILAAEAAPLQVWFEFAKAYLSQGKEDAFVHICSEGVKDEVTAEVVRFFGVRPIYEQIQFHCGLAAVQLAKAQDEKEKAVKNSLLAQVAKHLSSAAGLNPEEQLVAVGYGMLNLAKGDTAAARNDFTRACSLLNNNRTNIVGHLALASMLYDQKLYHEALAVYRRALLEHPSAPPEVRLGIAACLFRLGDMAGASSAYDRVLTLDPGSADAHLGLAVIKFNALNLQQGLADGLKLLVRAYELDPTHLGVVLLLAHYCLLRGNYQQALQLARQALASPDVTTARAECSLLLARALHALGQTAEARKQYLAAAKLEPGAALPHYGLAQMYLAEQELAYKAAATNATTELEQAVRVAPTFLDALKVLGQLVVGNRDKVRTTLTLLQTAVTRAAGDAELWELLAELSASTGDHPGALRAYRKALDLQRARRHDLVQRLASAGGGVSGEFAEEQVPPIPVGLLNNTAVLMYRAGEVQGAQQLLEEAAAAATGPAAPLQAPAHRLALEYNTARLQEACGQLQAAQKAYQALLSREPQYVDCLLRLACIARARGDTATALDWGQRALTLHPGHLDVLALLSQLHMERKDLSNADKMIKELLRCAREQAKQPLVADDKQKAAQEARVDPFGALAHGNLMLASAPSERKHSQDVVKAEACLFRALELYHAVLLHDPRNAFAANGIGAALAELGRLDEAQSVFKDVQEVAAASGAFLHIPDLYINLAHVALAKQEYTSAVRLYRLAMDKLDTSKQNMAMLYLARAHYDSDDLQASKACLIKAIHVTPLDYILHFNLAVTMQEFAQRTYRKKRNPGDATRKRDYEQAQQELGSAAAIFEQLLTRGHKATRLDDKKLKVHIKFCTDLKSQAAAHLEEARREAEEMEVKRQEQERLRSLVDSQRTLELLKQEETARLMQEARERKAKEALEKVERLKLEWRAAKAAAEGRDFDDGEGQGGEGGGGKKKKGKGGKGGKGGKKGARSLAADDEVPTDEEDGGKTGQRGGAKSSTPEPAAIAEGENLFGSDDDDDDDPTADRERELLAKAGLGSDDDDSEDNSGGADSDAGDGAGSRKRKLTAAMGGGRLRKSSRLTEAGTAPIDGEGGGADERALFDDDEEEGAAAPPQVRQSGVAYQQYSLASSGRGVDYLLIRGV